AWAGWRCAWTGRTPTSWCSIRRRAERSPAPRHLESRERAPGRAPSAAGQDHEPLGGARHRDIVVHRPLDALAEALRTDQDDQVELEALREPGGQRTHPR